MNAETLRRLKDGAREHVSKARALAEKATAENRPLTDAEKTDYDAAIAKGRQMLDQIKVAKADEQVLADAKALADELGMPVGFRGPGAAGKGGSVWAEHVAKAMLADMPAGGSKAIASGSLEIPSILSPGVVALPDHPTRVVDLLLDRRKLDGNVFDFLQQTVRTNNAAPVADGGTKPTSVNTFHKVEGRARVIAHLSEPIPQRFFADHDELVNILGDEMERGVRESLEAEIVAGAGTGEHFTGLLETSGTVSVAFNTDLLTTGRKARTALENLGEIPTAWLFNPDDLETLDLLRDAEDRFYGKAVIDTILGALPRIGSASVPAGTAVLGDFGQCAIYIREDMRLDTDLSGDNFAQNTAVLRAEGRYGFAVLRPQAFAVVDLTA